eukprot:10190588-Ditylum_brightwellii.AAC.1
MAPEVMAAAAAKFETIVQTENDKTFLDMYWIDAHEKNGIVYLYGKVAVPGSNPAAFTSICTLIHNNVRNLFVLPNTKETSLLDVHKEISGVMKRILPKQEGSEWKAKPVKRQYAFDDPTIPREEREYLKVVYHSKYPPPTPEQCGPGNSYSRILNAGATPMETFLVKRKLMGPCWVRIYNPKPMEGSMLQTWCKLEGFVESPKDLVRLDRVEGISDEAKMRAAPPIVTVTIKMKTVVHPKTHKNEIVSLCALCHKRVLLDSSTEGGGKYMSQLSLIRPLGLAAEQDGSTLESFPRDLDETMKREMPTLRRMPNERA